MLTNPDNKNISIPKFDQESLTTYMLELWLFIIH